MTYYFYDLETSGFSPKEARVMQFAGLRTDMNLKPIGEPHNFFIKLTEDVLPEPDAILLTGITPQQTQANGITEAEFLELFSEEIAKPNTVFTGFNTIRFDDEFMRYLHYRNFYDPYEWQYKDGKSRWDLLDVVRMTRALRPGGIKWPFDAENKPSNRLELLSAVNKLDHTSAHDALSDVLATISLARLIKQKQPKLFAYLLKMRDKKEIAKLVLSEQPFLYTSGKYKSEFEKTTVVSVLAEHPKKQGVLVYDLRQDPKPFLKMNPEQLAAAWKWQQDPDATSLPIKTLLFNRCPAVAPLGVLDTLARQRLAIDPSLMLKRKQEVTDNKFITKVLKALEILDKSQQAQFFSDPQFVDGQLYDGFFSDNDRKLLPKVRNSPPNTILEFNQKLKDKRLRELLPLYKARNFPKDLSSEERAWWENYYTNRLMNGGIKGKLGRYFAKIQELRQLTQANDERQYLLTELELYGQSIMPVS